MAGKIALVTGTACGISRVIALHLRRTRASVFVSDVANADPLQAEVDATAPLAEPGSGAGPVTPGPAASRVGEAGVAV